MSSLKFVNINKIYDNNVQAVFDFNLEIKDKEFIVFVGPSGCGKSTTLRMVAGLEEITEGELYIDDKLVNDIHPKDRDIAMVFQSYALYPHMSVYENMAFGLKLRRDVFPVLDENGNQVYTYDEAKVKVLEGEIKKLDKENDAEKIAELEKEIEKVKAELNVPEKVLRHYTKQEIDNKINVASEILGLNPYLKRKPKELSGGQRQRVALGRAIVREPKVFLMDEPLSNLDAKLRVQMRSEIIKIHQRVGATTIYVTHDQTEAMTMADRIVVMRDGYIQQIGTPDEVYNNPANQFVAGFIGSPAMNFVKAKYVKGEIVLNDSFKFALSKEDVKLHDEYYANILPKREEFVKAVQKEVEEYNKSIEGSKKKQPIVLEEYEEYKGAVALLEKTKEIIKNKEHDVILGVRPEDIYISKDPAAENPSKPIELECDISELLGHERIIYTFLNKEERVTIKVNAKWDIKQGNKEKYVFNLGHIHIFDEDSTDNILFKGSK